MISSMSVKLLSAVVLLSAGTEALQLGKGNQINKGIKKETIKLWWKMVREGQCSDKEFKALKSFVLEEYKGDKSELVNMKDKKGNTALHHFVYGKQHELSKGKEERQKCLPSFDKVKDLLTVLGIDPTIKNTAGYSALKMANDWKEEKPEDDTTNSIQELVEKSIDDALWFKFVNKRDWLVAQGYKEGRVNVQDIDGNTALHIAVGNEDEEMVWRLVHWGADLTIKNSDGWTARDLTKGSGQIEKLLRFADYRSEWFETVRGGDVKALKELHNRLKKDYRGKFQFDINMKDDKGYTALILAVRQLNKAMVKQILKWKPILTMKGPGNKLTALQYAEEITHSCRDSNSEFTQKQRQNAQSISRRLQGQAMQQEFEKEPIRKAEQRRRAERAEQTRRRRNRRRQKEASNRPSRTAGQVGNPVFKAMGIVIGNVGDSLTGPFRDAARRLA